MTETLSRHVTRAPVTPPRPLRAGASAAGRAALIGLAVVGTAVLAVWTADPRVDAPLVDALRAVGQAYLVLHGAGLEFPGGRIGLAPLGLLALPAVLLVRAGRRAARQSQARSGRDVIGAAVGVTVPYAAGAGLLAVLSAGPDTEVGAGRAVLVTALLGATCSAAGALRGAGLGAVLWVALPAAVRTSVLATVAALAVLVAGGAVLAGLALALQADEAAELARAGGPGLVGGLALLVVGLGLAPNAAVWGACWLAGPGFAVGAGTSVSPSAHELGAVPALPLLAALPGGAVPGWAGALAYAVPLAAGAVAGWVVWRRTRLPGMLRAAAAAAAIGPVVGLAMALLAWMSGGPAGGERLAVVGPSAWAVAMAVSVPVALAAAATAALLHRRTS